MEVHGFMSNGYIDVTIDGQRMSVPDDMSNRHRRMIDDWVKAGNTIPPYVAPVPTPEETRAAMPSLTARQFRIGLVRAGFSTEAVDSAIAAIGDPALRAEAKIEWEYSSEFVRTSPTIRTLAAAMGISETQVDAMWMAAVDI